jgi:putative ABC transport system substrate-binding protein
VIVATGGTPAVLPAIAATTTIPIVFITGGDPIKFGLVRSLNRPGGNVTGVNIFIAEMEAKRLGLLRDLVPTAGLVGMLLNPNNPNFDNQSNDVQKAARAISQKIQIVHAGTEAALGTALRSLVQLGTEGLLVGGDPFFNSRRNLLVALAARHGIPAIYDQREYALAGGLMSYGTSLAEAYRQVGIYTGRILKGEKPADLPVIQPTKFELVRRVTRRLSFRQTLRARGLRYARALGVEEDGAT